MLESNNEPVEVLPPENTLPVTIAGYDSSAVLSQYNRANAGMLEVLRFGAMMLDIDTNLQRETRKGCIQDGESLKGWLAENCPDVNYKTAHKYKSIADMVLSEMKLPNKLPRMAALPAADGTPDVQIPEGCKVSAQRIEKIQVEVWETVKDKSMRQLVFDFKLSNPKPRGGDRRSGRPPVKLTEEQKFQQRIDAAREVFRRDLDSLLNHVRRNHHMLLGEAHLDVAIHKLEVLLARLKEAKGVGVDKNRQKEA